MWSHKIFKYQLKTETSVFSNLIDIALIYDDLYFRDKFWLSKNGKVHDFCDLDGIAHNEGVGQWWLVSFSCREGRRKINKVLFCFNQI